MADQLNIGKTLLIAGVALGVVAGGLGVYTMTSSDVNKLSTAMGGQSQDNITGLTDKVKVMDKAVAEDVTFCDPAIGNAGEDVRYAPVFYSPELWQITDVGGKKEIIDIYNPEAVKIHSGIPYSWFIKHGLQREMCFSNAATIDSDDDGFSNLEEYKANTNPCNKMSTPPLITTESAKLEVVEIKREKFIIEVDSNFAYETAVTPDTEATIKLMRKAGAKPTETVKVKVGASFGFGNNKQRFTVLGFEQNTYHDKGGNETKEMAVKVRDNQALKEEDKEFLIRPGKLSSAKDETSVNKKGYVINDAYAVLRATAGPKRGEVTERIQENSSFIIPGSKEAGKEVKCTLESIDEAGSVNIHAEGAESPVSVPMAADAKVKGGKGSKAGKGAKDAAAETPEENAGDAPAEEESGAKPAGKQKGKSGKKGKK